MTRPIPGPLDATVVVEQITLGARRVAIARPPRAEDLIDEHEYEADERLPYWADLWPSAHVLAEELSERRPKGLAVLELGCGVGLPAVVAALAGAAVLATDWYRPALDFAAHNAARNGASLETLLVDWRDPPTELTRHAPFDLVVGADILYEQRNGVALAAIIPALLRPGGEALIADPRRPHADELIDRLCALGWRHRIDERLHRARIDEAGPLIHLHRLVAPG